MWDEGATWLHTVFLWKHQGLFVGENQHQLCFSISSTSEHAAMEQEVPGLVTKPFRQKPPGPPASREWPLLGLPTNPTSSNWAFPAWKSPASLFHQGHHIEIFCLFPLHILYLRNILAFCSLLEKLKKFKTQVVARRKRQCYNGNKPTGSPDGTCVVLITLHTCWLESHHSPAMWECSEPILQVIQVMSNRVTKPNHL